MNIVSHLIIIDELAVDSIKKAAIESAQKIYVGDDAKWLEGADKIPVYLSKYLEKTTENAEQYRLNFVRTLRDTQYELVKVCESIPKTVLEYVTSTYTGRIETKINQKEKEFAQEHRKTEEMKERHKFLFRPNLKNPANKAELDELTETEEKRRDEFLEIVDDFQLEMVDTEMDRSKEFRYAFMNHL